MSRIPVPPEDLVDRHLQAAPIIRSGRSFTDQVERTLREQIVGGRFPPGGRVNEAKLATEFGVSRGPVREALQRLAGDGLVELQAHRGAFVRRLGPADVRDLFEVRMALECTAVRLAARRASPESRARLRALSATAGAGNAAGQSARERFQGPRDVHTVLAEAADNPALAAHAGLVNRELRLLRSQAGEAIVRAQDATAEHAAVVDAVLDGDGDRAAEAMARHLRGALEHALRTLAMPPALSAPPTPPEPTLTSAVDSWRFRT